MWTYSNWKHLIGWSVLTILSQFFYSCLYLVNNKHYSCTSGISNCNTSVNESELRISSWFRCCYCDITLQNQTKMISLILQPIEKQNVMVSCPKQMSDNIIKGISDKNHQIENCNYGCHWKKLIILFVFLMKRWINLLTRSSENVEC